jgi:thiamine kinase-like enzyme
MADLITDITQVTPEWLTAALRNAGVLDGGRVTAVDAQASATFTATAIPLRVGYSDDAPAQAPANLFLKLGRRKTEVDYYNTIWPLTKAVPTVGCYEAVFDNRLGQSHLLMDDISAAYVEAPAALPPTFAQAERMVDILAALHAQWWEHPRLAGDLRPILDDSPAFVLSQAQEHFSDFVDSLGDRLSDKRRRWFERVIESLPLPAWSERLEGLHGVTLAHGDTHWWNFLLSRSNGEGDILLIDWAVWHLDIGAADIAYMIGPHSYPEWRERFERKLVQRYHNSLITNGVSGYDWARCWQDYRMCMANQMVWPIFHYHFGQPGIWWRNLECITSTFEDLQCEEFIA